MLVSISGMQDDPRPCHERPKTAMTEKILKKKKNAEYCFKGSLTESVRNF